MDPVTVMALRLGAAIVNNQKTRSVLAGLVLVGLALLGTMALTPVVALSQTASAQRAQQQMQPSNGDALTCPDSVIVTDFDGDQTKNAAVIYRVAQQLKLGDRAAVVGIATALQESTLRNRPDGDLDSVGLFQQRAPWGPFLDRTDPAKSARMFFAGGHGGQRGLKDVPGWRTMPLTVAAQAVQVSGLPDAYAKWEGAATKLVAQLGGSVPLGGVCEVHDGDQGGGPVPTEFDKQGNPRTVEQAIAWMKKYQGSGAPGEKVLNACERYMNLSYGLGGGYPTAFLHWAAVGPRHASATDVPPRGALVFWRTSNPAGHVALSLGNGIIASTDFNPKTGQYQAGMLGIGPIADIDKWGPRLGWRAPNFRIGSEG